MLPPGCRRTFHGLCRLPRDGSRARRALCDGLAQDEPEREAEREHQVRVTIARPFAIGAFAVTRGEFAAFVAATGHKLEQGCYFWTGTTWEERPDRSWQSPGFLQDDRHPVTCVDLRAAKAYVAWLSGKTGKAYRLPSETEREYATRAGTTTPFWWGGSISTDDANYDGTKRYERGPAGEWRQRTVRVDSFQPNAWGLYNVHGNVWDWTDDCWNESNGAIPGTEREADRRLHLAGCPWRCVELQPDLFALRFRYWNLSHNRSGVQGFRVAGAF